jgi:poly(A)-specific ribonuclease
MDVVDATLNHHLPWILYELASCCFVSLDLEMSGITMSPDKPGGEVQTLQERYVEVKAAAEKYQVLQVGLTICRENLVTGVFIQKGHGCIRGADLIQGNISSCHTTSI